MTYKYIIDIGDFATQGGITRIYLETDYGYTFWPMDDDAGTPARLEIGGDVAIEFECEATIRDA